jgi:hypothetical protein
MLLLLNHFQHLQDNAAVVRPLSCQKYVDKRIPDILLCQSEHLFRRRIQQDNLAVHADHHNAFHQTGYDFPV